jgi:tetratricopeptide (TPR) repeat protein
MRNGKAAGALVLALVLVGGTASAQRHGGGPAVGASGPAPGQPGQPAVKYRIQPLNLHRETLGTEAFASAARARMRNGDCAGALDDFDLALQSSTTDATLNRDRGLCHERLGDPYPAIEDYRAYVTAAPDAADAEGIRQRLGRLEMEVYKHSSESTDSPDEGRPSGGSSSPSASSSATTASSTVVVGSDEPKRDAMEEVEHDHDELSSSMRAGKGFGLAPFFSEQKWFTPNSSIGDSTTWSESVGLQVRYSVSSGSAFFIEGGWQLFNSTSVATISGLTSQLGYELRVPLDYRYNNQFLFGLGLGFEYLVVTPNIVSAPGTSVGIFVPQVKAGWRHMLTTSVGLDLALGFGITGEALATSPYLRGSGSSPPPVEILAANLGVVWGL